MNILNTTVLPEEYRTWLEFYDDLTLKGLDKEDTIIHQTNNYIIHTYQYEVKYIREKAFYELYINRPIKKDVYNIYSSIIDIKELSENKAINYLMRIANKN